MEIYVLTAQHGKRLGPALELFATLAAANIRAAEFVNTFLAKCGLDIEVIATPVNWERKLMGYITFNDRLDAAWKDAYVRVKATEVQVAAPAIDPAETACRAVGWVQGGDNSGFIYNARRFGSWKEAASYDADADDTLPVPDEPSAFIYETWQACAEGQGLLESAA
jgi:hypothetical protein